MSALADIRTNQLYHTCQKQESTEICLLKKSGPKIEDWIIVAEDRVQWRAAVNTAMNCLAP
jgi:hypothetical protein